MVLLEGHRADLDPADDEGHGLLGAQAEIVTPHLGEAGVRDVPGVRLPAGLLRDAEPLLAVPVGRAPLAVILKRDLIPTVNTLKCAWRLSKNGKVCAALPDDLFTRAAGVILLGSFCQ